MIPRQLEQALGPLRSGYAAVAITGPRQSGKTTFARANFPDLDYVNFESPYERAEFQSDPKGFFARYPAGAVLDEVQNVPDVFSFLQVQIDEEGLRRHWVLTGSQQFDLNRGIAQSLAGRVARLELLPLSFRELALSERRPVSLADAVLRGGYPALYDPARQLDPIGWLDGYIATFVERDVRQLVGVRDRSAFDRFLRLCAARTGQVLAVADLARDCGVDSKTIGSWISVLEACYVVRLVSPYFRNFGKRLTKRPKLYFLDTGLACRLLHIADVNQLRSNPMWGALVETWCAVEVLKSRLHRGLPPDLWCWRSSDGIEVDLLLERGAELVPIEIKAASTPAQELSASLRKFATLATRDDHVRPGPGLLVYGGEERRAASFGAFVPWHAIDDAIQGVT